MATFTNFVLLLIFLLGAIFVYYKRKFNYWKRKGVPYAQPTIIFGNILDWFLSNQSPGQYFIQLCNEFKGPYFGFYGLSKPYLVIKDPNLIKRIMIKDFNVFPNRFFFIDNNIDPILSNSLLGIKTPHWKSLRIKLSPVFTSRKMEGMVPLMIQCGENLERYMSNMVDIDLEMKEVAVRYTTDVIATCAFGINVNSLLNKEGEFFCHSVRLTPQTIITSLHSMSYVFAPNLVKIFKFPFFGRRSVTFFREVFNDAIEQRKSSNLIRNDLIDILIEIQKNEEAHDDFVFDENRLIAQAIMFFGAGFETTSSTVAFTLHELSVNTAIQNKLRDEVMVEIEKHGGLTYEAIQDMKYLQMVICETLRKYPPTPLIQREASEDYKIAETGLVVEKGTPIIIPQFGLHWDSQYFPNPEVYDPERFSDANKHKINNYVYLPFGTGPRNCIGERFGLLSSKLGIIHIIKSFRLEKCPKTIEPIVFARTPLLKSKYGIPLTCKKL